ARSRKLGFNLGVGPACHMLKLIGRLAFSAVEALGILATNRCSPSSFKTCALASPSNPVAKRLRSWTRLSRSTWRTRRLLFASVLQIDATSTKTESSPVFELII